MNPNFNARTIFVNDNLPIMRGMNDECVDLIYLDPPFNSNREYLAPMNSAAAGARFSDIFRKDDYKEEWVAEIEGDHPKLHAILRGIEAMGRESDYAYCVFMAIRLLEMHRILKDTGSVYLHCDPTMSHYLKLVMDSVFGRKMFRNEVVWCYSGGGVPRKDFPRKHDIILRYGKTDRVVFNVERKPYKENTRQVGKHSTLSGGADIDLERGTPVTDWWTDIKTVTGWSPEKTDYPTQKPLTMLVRIIKASSNEGDMVLDPFCGCATACVAAEALQRKWVGIDKSDEAHKQVTKRLRDTYGEMFTPVTLEEQPPIRNAEHNPDKRHVYIMRCEAVPGRYKVGFTSNLEARVRGIMGQIPGTAEVLHSRETEHYRELESFMHNKHNEGRQKEWLEADLEELKRDIDEWSPSRGSLALSATQQDGETTTNQ